MAEDNEDIFGKIDALLERRVGFGAGAPQPNAGEEFPLLTDVVEAPAGATKTAERRHNERRQGDRRLLERRREPTGPAPRTGMSDAQFTRFLELFEQKLEDLFIRQQMRMEESIRRAVGETLEKLKDDAD